MKTPPLLIILGSCVSAWTTLSVAAQTAFTYDSPGNLIIQSNVPAVALPQFQQVVPEFVGVASNGLVSISVPVIGVGPITYQWLLNSAPVSSATNDSFVIANAGTANLGNYQLVAATSAGSATSAVVNVSFFDPSGSYLPVAWEQYYFGSNGLSAFANPDHSGAPLYQDYAQGFNPTNSGSANAYFTTGLYWLNGGGGNWSTATNWSIGQVPGPISSPVITLGGNYTVTLDTPATVNNLTVGSSSGVQAVSIPAGQSLTLINGGTFNTQGQLNMANSTLTVGEAGQITLAGGGTNLGGNFQLGLGALVNLSGNNWLWQGTVQGSGQGTVMLSGAAFVNAGSGLTLNFSASDPLEMNGGQLRGAITNLGSVEVAGSAANWLQDPITFFNQGLVQATEGSALWLNTCGSGPANFYNLAGATYQFAGDCIVTQVCTGSDVFQNQGLVWKSGGTGTAAILVPFNNLGGTIQVDSGTLALSTGGYSEGNSSNGTFIVASGAALDLTGGTTPTWAGQMNGGGLGAVLLSSGTLEASNLTLAFTNSLFHWIGGAMNGTITNVGIVDLAGTNLSVLVGNPTTLINRGLVEETAIGGLEFNTCSGSPITFYNQAGATYQFTSDSQIIQVCTGTGLFQNQGLVWKSGGNNTTTIAVPFDNLGGAIQVDSGTLVLSTGGYGEGSSSNGTFTVASGASLDLTGGTTPTWAGQMNGGGLGAVLLSSGTLIASNLTLAFTNSLFHWSGGALAGRTTNIGTVELVGTNTSVMASKAIFVNQGLVQETGSGGLLLGICSGSPTAFYNPAGGTYQFLADSSIQQYNCQGTLFFRIKAWSGKAAAQASQSIGLPFNNLGGSIEVDSGTLVLNTNLPGEYNNGGGTSSNGTFTVASGAALDLTGGNSATWAGQITGSGGGTVTLNGGTLTASPSLTLNFPTNLFQCNGGELAGTITNVGIVRLVGTNYSMLLGHTTFVNQGLVQETGSGGLYFNICNGSQIVFYNPTGTTYQITTDSSIFQNNCGGTLFFQNQGLLWKSGGTNTTTISVPFNNLGGTVQVDSGTLDLDTSLNGGNAYGNGAGTSSNATFIVAGGAALHLADNVPTWMGQMTGSGTGTMLLSNVTINASPSATLNFPTNMLQCNGAELAGTITNVGMVKLVGTNYTILLGHATFVNHGLVQETGSGGLFFNICNGSPVEFYNPAGTTYQITTDSSIFQNNCGGTLFFQNQGLLWKSGGTNTTTISVPLNNLDGTVQVDSGTLDLDTSLNGGNAYGNGAGTSSNATFIVATGAALDLADNVPTWAGQMTGSGGGTMTLSNITLTASPNVTLNFPGNMLQCIGTELAGTFTNLGMMKLVGTNYTILLGHATFVNQGLVQETGSGGLFFNICNGSPITFSNLPGATFQFTTDSSIYQNNCGGTLSFQNRGLFWKSGGTNTTSISVPLINNGGSIEVDSGTLLLDTTLNGGNAAGNGSANYTQNGGSFTVQLGGTNAGQSGEFVIHGPATLSGPLNVMVSSNFAPAIGNQFTILTCSNRSGTFSPLNVPQGISVNYTTNSVFLTVTSAVPAQVISPQVSGGNFVFNFATANGQSYTVQQNTNLATPNWTLLTNITGNGLPYLFMTPITNVPQLFIRVREP